jgi:hypothetical protein
MFYCDDCAKNKKYPIWAKDDMKSYGPCEICRNVRPCNDLHHELLELGPVLLYHFKRDVFLKPDKKSFQAQKGKFIIIGFDMKKLFEDDNTVFVPVNLHQEFSEKTKAVNKVISLRKKQKQDSKSQQNYFLFNDKGFLEKINE